MDALLVLDRLPLGVLDSVCATDQSESERARSERARSETTKTQNTLVVPIEI